MMRRISQSFCTKQLVQISSLYVGLINGLMAGNFIIFLQTEHDQTALTQSEHKFLLKTTVVVPEVPPGTKDKIEPHLQLNW